MKLSVVIACFNGADFIANQLEALASQRYAGPWELVISDNGSTDESLAIVKTYRERIPELRIVDSSDRQSRAHARNVGVDVATGDALLFLDQDDQVASGWLAAMSKALHENDFVACRVETEKLNKPLVRKSRGCFQRRGLQKYTYPSFLPHAAGCTLGIKRSLHKEIGGLDETFFSLDDTDYCWRIQLRGTKLHFVPDAVLHYRYRKKFTDLFRQAFEYSEENVKLYKRYCTLGMPMLTWRDPILRWKQLIKRLYRIRNKGDFAHCLWLLGWRSGRLIGSIKYKVFAL